MPVLTAEMVAETLRELREERGAIRYPADPLTTPASAD